VAQARGQDLREGIVVRATARDVVAVPYLRSRQGLGTTRRHPEAGADKAEKAKHSPAVAKATLSSMYKFQIIQGKTDIALYTVLYCSLSKSI
jgi:hypothetical protein